MFTKTSLLFAAAMAASAVAHSPVGVQRRELVYRLRQMAERAEIYPVTSVPAEVLQPSVTAGYDSVDPNTGAVTCGPGRSLTSDNECQITVTTAPEFAISEPLTEPQSIAVPITWADGISGPDSVMNVYLCASICAADSGCTGLYFLPGTSTGTCWKIGGDGTYASTDASIPFTPSTGTRMAKRAAGTTGIFAPGGQVAISTAAVDASNPTVGCIPDLGDAPQEDLSCTCGAGRITNASGSCAYAPSAAMRMSRKVKRDIYGGVPW